MSALGVRTGDHRLELRAAGGLRSCWRAVPSRYGWRCVRWECVVVCQSPLASLASAAGYADHAHLIRDCRAITGMAPGRFLATYFPTFPDMSDPYKTAGPFAVMMAQ